MCVFDLRNNIAKRRFVKIERLNILLKRIVDFLLSTSRISKVNGFVLLAETCDLPPAIGLGIDKRRLVRKWNACNICKVQCIHKTPLHFTSIPHVFCVIIENSGNNRCGDCHHASRHRHARTGINRRSFFGNCDSNFPLCLSKSLGWLLIPNPNSLFKERIKPLCKLFNFVFTTPEFSIETAAFASSLLSSRVREISLVLFSNTNSTLSNDCNNLSIEPVSSFRTEIVRSSDFREQFF